MISLRAPAAVCVVLAALGLVGACSSSSKAPATPSDPGASDAAAGDAPLGPLVCDLPVAASCPATAPCSFAAWGCALPACDGYVVVTDGKWVYYYSSYGGALVGVVAAGDAGEVACPYGFVAPAACAAVLVSACPDGGDAGDDGGSGDGGDD